MSNNTSISEQTESKTTIQEDQKAKQAEIHELNYLINFKEAKQAIHKLKEHKSPGEDGIRSESLKWGGQTPITHLHKAE